MCTESPFESFREVKILLRRFNLALITVTLIFDSSSKTSTLPHIVTASCFYVEDGDSLWTTWSTFCGFLTGKLIDRWRSVLCWRRTQLCFAQSHPKRVFSNLFLLQEVLILPVLYITYLKHFHRKSHPYLCFYAYWITIIIRPERVCAKIIWVSFLLSGNYRRGESRTIGNFFKWNYLLTPKTQ